MFRRKSVAVLLLYSFVSIVLITTIVLTLLNNYLFSFNFREEWKKRNSLSLDVVSTELREKVFFPIEQINKQIMTDTQSEMLSYLASEEESNVARMKVYSYLSRIATFNNEIIDHIDAYFIKKDVVISTRYGIKQLPSPREDMSLHFPWIELMEQSTEVARWIPTQKLAEVSDNYDVFTYVKTFPFRNEMSIADMCLAICIKESVISEILGKAREDTDENVYLVDSEMGFFTQLRFDLSGVSQASILDDAFFTDKLNNKNHYIMSRKLMRPNFIVVKTTPTASISKYIWRSSSFMLMFGFFALLLGFFVAKALSAKLYNPLGNLMKQLSQNISDKTIGGNEYEIIDNAISSLSQKAHNLDEAMEQNRPILLFRILLDLISEKGSVNSDEILDKLSTLGLCFDRKGFAMCVIQLNKSLLDKIAYKNAQIIKADLLVRINSLGDGKMIAAEIADSEILLLAGCNALCDLESLFGRIIAESSRPLNTISFISLGTHHDKLNEMHLSYKNAKRCSVYHFIYPERKILSFDALRSKDVSLASPNADLISSFTSALYKNDPNEISELLTEIKSQMQNGNYSYESCNSFILDVIFLLAQFLKKYNVRSNSLMCGNVFEQFYSIDNIDDVNIWVLTLCRDAFDKIQGNIQDNASELVLKIREFVKSNISDDTSLTAVAEHIGISVSYLSTIFKKETGITYLDYVNEQKFLIARELLENTNKTLDEISCLAGFGSSNYFIKVFRKRYGLTPNNYRRSTEQGQTD